jgi:hypothetical protein
MINNLDSDLPKEIKKREREKRNDGEKEEGEEGKGERAIVQSDSWHNIGVDYARFGDCRNVADLNARIDSE